MVLDSGCTSYIFCDKGFFVELHDVSSKFCVNANNSVSPVKDQGVAKISLLDKRDVSHVLNLDDCLYVPNHWRNLLSVSALGQKGAKVVFDDTCELRCSDKLSFLFVQRNGLYVTKAFSVCSSNFSSTCKVDLDLWHCRLGHSNKRDVQKLSKSVQGRKLHNSSIWESFCDICPANELNRKPPISTMALRRSSKLELVYFDVRGPMETTSFGGHRYIVSFIDSYSRRACACFMKHKSEVLKKFRHFCMDECVPKTFSSLTLRSDGGGEYDNKAYDEFCFAQRIKREMTAPCSPHQNGVAERRWQTVGDMARCLLNKANLPNSFWVRAVHVAFYLTNRCLNCSLPPNKTPFELFYGRKPDLSNLKVFGCSVFRFLEVGVKKLDSKAVKEVFVGYGRTHDSYYLYNPDTGKISRSKKVSFNEKDFLGFGSSFSEDCEFLPELKSSLDVEEEQVVSSKPLKSVAENDDSRTQETSPVPESSTSNSNPDFYAEFQTRNIRHVKAVERYGCTIDISEDVSLVECFSCEEVPNSSEEVKKSQSRDESLEAMTEG